MFMPTGTFIVDFSIKINSLEMKTLVCHNLIPRQLIDEFCLKQNCRDFFLKLIILLHHGIDLQKDIGKKTVALGIFQFLMAYNIFIAMLHNNKVCDANVYFRTFLNSFIGRA